MKNTIKHKLTSLLLVMSIVFQFTIPTFASEPPIAEQEILMEVLSKFASDETNPTENSDAQQIDIIYMDGSSEEFSGTEIARFEVNANDKTNTIRLANTIHTITNWQEYVTKPNREFTGWKCASLGDELGSNFMTNTIWTGEQDLYMYAQYEYTAPPVADAFTITFKDGLMGENLGTLEVSENYNLTQSEISIIAPTHTDFEFIGWSTNPDATETSDIINISKDTFLYPIYIFIGEETGKVDTELLKEAIIAAESYENMIEELGMTRADIEQLEAKDARYYEYLNNYIESSMEELGISDSVVTYASPRAEEIVQTADMAAYAVEMANWSTSKRPDLDYNMEVVYMYMSHFVDIQTPFEVSRVDQHSESGLLAKWITDYCRRCYDQYFKTGSANQFAGNFLKGLTLLGDKKTILTSGNPLKIKDATDKISAMTAYLSVGLTESGMFNSSQEEKILDKIDQLTVEAVNHIDQMPYENEQEFIELIKQLENEIKSDLGWWFETEGLGDINKLALSIGNAIVCSAIAIVSGGGIFLALLPFAGFYIDTVVNIIDKVNFAALIRMRNFRTVERIYYYWGMSDGRN